MILGLHELKKKEHLKSRNFSTVNFLDRVILDPVEVAPDGLFERDMVLTREQAQTVFARRIGGNENNDDFDESRVLTKWPLPILYTFDGTHCKGLLYVYIFS